MPAPLAVAAPAPAATNQNGAATAPAAAPAVDIAALTKERDDYKQRFESIDKKLRVNTIEMKKFSDEKRGLGAKLSEHSSFEGAFKAAGLTAADLRNFKVNPMPVLQKALGNDWYDKIVEMRLNGGAPTADAVAAEIARAKDEAIAAVKDEAQRERDSAAQRQREAAEAARAELARDAGSFLEKSGGDYPVFEGYPREQVARAIAAFQEQEFHRTGKVVTTKEAADALEQAEVARAEKLAGIEKYRSKLTEKLKPASVVPVVGSRSAGERSTERRTLSNDLTATTPGAKRTARTDDERMKAILALDLSKAT